MFSFFSDFQSDVKWLLQWSSDIILGENNSQRLILQDGLPATVPELVEHIKKQCGVQSDFRLQFMDADFGNEFTNLTSVSEIEDKSTTKLIFDSGLLRGTPAPPYSAPSTSRCGDDSSLSSGSFDTDILLSPDSAASRSSGWPVFVVPDSHMIVSCSWKKPMLHSKQLELCSTLTSALNLLFLTV